MSAIFSVQNLQTFLRRKNFRPPSRGGPPGPERPPPPPPNRGRSPPERGPSPEGREGRSVVATGAFVSSAITLLHPASCSVLCSQFSETARFAQLNRCCRNIGSRRFRACGGCFFCGHDGGLRAYLLLRVAKLLDLLQALLFFVDAHGEELDYLLGDAQAPLEFVDHRSRAFDRHQNVDAFAEFAHGVGQTALAHAVHTFYATGGRGHGGLQIRNQLVQIFVRHIRPDNKHQLISTIHFSLKQWPGVSDRWPAKSVCYIWPLNTDHWPLLFFFFFPVEAVHRRRRTFRQNHFHRFFRGIEHSIQHRKIRLAQRRQQIALAVFDFVLRSHANPDAQKILRAQHPDDRLDPVMPRRTSPRMNSQRAQRKIQLVLNHDQI